MTLKEVNLRPFTRADLPINRVRPAIIESIEVATGSIAFAVDPALRRRGIGRGVIAALLIRPELASVELDCEGMLYYRAARPAGGAA